MVASGSRDSRMRCSSRCPSRSPRARLTSPAASSIIRDIVASPSPRQPGGDLRVSFHHGAFRDPETVQKAARSAALVVADIQADAIGSFERSDGDAHPGLRRQADIRILIEFGR